MITLVMCWLVFWFNSRDSCFSFSFVLLGFDVDYLLCLLYLNLGYCLRGFVALDTLLAFVGWLYIAAMIVCLVECCCLVLLLCFWVVLEYLGLPTFVVCVYLC